VNICNSVLTHQFLVPIIVVFTKYDQFLRNVKMNLEDYGNPDANTIYDEAERQFEEHYLCHLDGVRFVRLESPFNIKRGGDMLILL
jgi:hypothetical protein